MGCRAPDRAHENLLSNVLIRVHLPLPLLESPDACFQKSRNFSGPFRLPQLPLYLRNAEVLSRQTSQSCNTKSMFKDQFFKTRRLQFDKWLLGPTKLSGLSRNRPQLRVFFRWKCDRYYLVRNFRGSQTRRALWKLNLSCRSDGRKFDLAPSSLCYGGPEGTTLLLENVVSFCKNVTVIFRIKHLSLKFCYRSL